MGSTGYQPVPSGNLPDGMTVTLEDRRTLRVFERAPHSVGQVARSTQPGGEAVETARPFGHRHDHRAEATVLMRGAHGAFA